MEQQLEVIRKMVQEKIPDKKVRTVWYITIDVQDNIFYGISGNNNKFFAVAKISPKGDVEIIR